MLHKYRVTLRLRKETQQPFLEHCLANDITPTDLINDLVSNYLEEQGIPSTTTPNNRGIRVAIDRINETPA